MREEIIRLIEQQLDIDYLDVQLDGNHGTLLVVSEQFAGLSSVKRQQKVYACLGDKIASGELHAVNIRALTPDQWDGVE